MKQWQIEKQRLGKKYRSTTHYILAGLIPYTEANVKLSFKPSAFFNDLEKLDQIKSQKKAIAGSYYRAIKLKLIELDDEGMPRLTEKGLRKIKPYKPKKLKNAVLMVIFDIPENQRSKRNHLRKLLETLSFSRIQHSVWISENDHRQCIKNEIDKYKLHNYVKVFESRLLKI